MACVINPELPARYNSTGIQSITIRQATPADVDDLVELLRELFSIETDFTFNGKRQRRVLKLLLDGVPDYKCVLVTESEGKVVEMCSAQTRISTAEGKLTGVIKDVVVSGRWRGKGIGCKLMEEIQQWGMMKNIERFQLLADKNNY